MSRLLLSYYGDDLTGSTDVMEALSSRGIPTVLFTAPPTEAQRRRFPEARAIGVAGTSRSETPAWMDRNLRPALEALRRLDAALCHYKVCSTFDSSPAVGSIGRAIDIGAAVFAQDTVPIVVGAPQLRRYTAFGHLFAAYRDEVFRIDRHPVMSRHPVTPMREADLRAHLAGQTERRIGLVDLAALVDPEVAARVERALAEGAGALLLDVADPSTQARAGRELWRIATGGRRFVVGSSGIEYAVLTEWVRLGLAPGFAEFAPLAPVDRIAVVSGSCSPTTETQIRAALADGFDAVAVDPLGLAGAGSRRAVDQAVAEGLAILARGRSPLVHTALGPATNLGSALDGFEGGRHAIGQGLGLILRGLVLGAGLRRVVVAGGDTSSHALRALDALALTTRMPLPASPGSPLCTLTSNEASLNGLEIAFKGGQIGGDQYFCNVRDGIVPAEASA